MEGGASAAPPFRSKKFGIQNTNQEYDASRALILDWTTARREYKRQYYCRFLSIEVVVVSIIVN
jgi:hypothetical protein